MFAKDITVTVNSFMLSSAPTLAEASPMAYDMLKVVARELVCRLKATDYHTAYAMRCKYGHIYTDGVIRRIIDEAIDEAQAERIEASRKKRMLRSHPQSSQPMLAII
jgi:hypothetical protein